MWRCGIGGIGNSGDPKMNNVGILLVTHSGIGAALIATTCAVLGQLPLNAEAFEVPFDADLNTLLPQASTALRRVDGGGGVLLLTDLYGATPANLAARLAQLGTQARRVSGVNLPMLLRIMNYPELALDELCIIAMSGARNGVVDDREG